MTFPKVEWTMVVLILLALTVLFLVAYDAVLVEP